MDVKMIWPHDKAGLSLISPNLSKNKAPGRKRAREREETLTPEVLSGALLNQSELWCPTAEVRPVQQWRERSGEGRTPVVTLGVKVIVTRL